jgi:putative DNA primase/helicase
MVTEYERVKSALMHLDAGCTHDDWVHIGMAAKSAGLSFDDFLSWSALGDNYAGVGDCLTKWKSFSESGPVTEATIFSMAYKTGWKDPAKGHQAANGSRASRPIAAPMKPPVTPVKQAGGRNPLDVWELCEPATGAHPYIARKGGIPDGLRIYPPEAKQLTIGGKNIAGYLVVPVAAPDDGRLLTLQFVPGEGDKLNLPRAKFYDGFFTVGDIAGTGRVYIVEGIGQAWACHAATDAAAVVCFSAGRMATVAAALRAKYPTARLVLVPDRAKEKQAAEIAAAVNCEWCELPADKHANYDANDFALEFGADALAGLLEATHKPVVEYPLSVAFADELPDAFTPIDELVQGVLTAGDGSVLYGDSNSGKTFFAIDLACAVARGVPWMGRQTEPGLVVYLAAESPSSVRSRLQAYQKHHRVRVPNFAIVQSPVDLFAGEADTDAVIQLVRQLEAQRGQRVRLIVGDTLARLSAGANENAGQDMGLVVRRIDRIRTDCNAHFLLIHHSGKTAAAGARGWSGVRAAVDTEIEVTDSPAGRCAEITKQRDLGTKGERIGFRLDTVTLGLTKWQGLATSCVVVSADAPEKTTGKRIGEIGGAILELLRSKVSDLKKGEVVKHFDGQYVKSAVYREIKKLVESGQVKECLGTVSVVDGGAKGAN